MKVVVSKPLPTTVLSTVRPDRWIDVISFELKLNPFVCCYFSTNIEVNIISGKKICKEQGKLLNPSPTSILFITMMVCHVTKPSGNRVLIKEKNIQLNTKKCTAVKEKIMYHFKVSQF